MRRFPIQLFFIVAVLMLSATSAGQEKVASALEKVIAEPMAGKSGAVVVVEVRSGRILAQHNLKTAAQRVTAPGSVVKPFVLLELLRSGTIDPEQHIVCRRSLTIAGRRMDCTHSPAISYLNAADALAYSCNTYFAQASSQLSPSALAAAFERAGFSSRSGLTSDEAVGRVAVAADRPHSQLQALGYWGVAVTPLALLAAYRSLAIHKLNDDLPFAKPVFDGLEAAVRYGMAHDAQPTGVAAAGKTGTAAGLSPQTHGFFAGYAPADKPEIVLVIYLEHGRGSDAAALAALIFTAYGTSSRGPRATSSGPGR